MRQRLATDLPSVNRRVEVRTATASVWLPSRVEDTGRRRLTVAAPFDARGKVLYAPAGEPVVLRWTEPRGVGTVDATVAGIRHLPVPMWELRVERVPELNQRRRHVRVPVKAVAAAATGEIAWTLVTVDLAEGGMLCAAPAGVLFDPDEPAAVCLDLEGTTLRSRARVVRWSLTPEGATVAFSFTSLTQPDTDRLRRFLFSQQARQERDRW